jgi:hypothetical protein
MLVFALILSPRIVQAQVKPSVPIQSITVGAPRGIYVVCGTDIPFPSGKIQAYIVERRPVNQGVAWQEYAELRAPSNLAEFRARLQVSLRDVPEQIALEKIPTEELWKRAERFGTMDSLGVWQSFMPIRRAFGVAILDSTAPRMIAYQYRISAQTPKEKTVLVQSNDVLYPPEPNFEALRFSSRRGEANVITISWAAAKDARSERQAPRLFFTMRREAWKGDFTKITVERSVRSNKDSVFLTLRDTSVRDGALYQYCILPFDAVGNVGTASDTVVAAAFDMRRLPVPDSIVVDNATADKDVGLRIRWRMQYPANVAAIEIWRGTSFDGTFQKVATVSPNQRKYIDHTPTPMQEYWYYLVARGVMGETFPPSARIPGLFANAQPPLPPQIIEALGTAKGVRLVMRTPEPIRNFRVYRRNDKGEFSIASDALSARDSITVFEDTSAVLSGAKTYSYTVRSESLSYVESRNSDTVLVRPAKPVSAPLAPTFLQAIADKRYGRDSLTKPSIRLIWTDSDEEPVNLYGYRILRREASGSAPLTIFKDSLSAETNVFTDTTVTPDVLYEYAVQSLGFLNGETSPLSMRAQANVPKPNIKPLAPQGLHAFPDAEGAVRISWDMVLQRKPLLQLKLFRYERGKEPVQVAALEPQAQEYVDTSLDGGVLYFYFLTTLSNDKTESERSPEVGIRTSAKK